MSIFRKAKAETAAPDESFDEWRIVTPVGDAEYALDGYVSQVREMPDSDATRRYVEALADGLQRAGFKPEVTLTRKQELKR